MDADAQQVAALVQRLRAAGCVFAEDEAALILDASTSEDDVDRLASQRVAGLPLEHVLGWADFAGIRVPVDRGVFVPRPRTEFLIAAAVERLNPGAIILDLCCGSGAVAAAIASRVSVAVYATDIDQRATANARRTLAPWGATVITGDLFDGLPESLRGEIAMVTIIAPYVPTDEIALLPHEARDFEPLSALDGGTDGLDILRRAIVEAPRWLRPGGYLLTEVAEHQAARAARAMDAAGLTSSVVTDDEATVLFGQMPA